MNTPAADTAIDGCTPTWFAELSSVVTVKAPVVPLRRAYFRLPAVES